MSSRSRPEVVEASALLRGGESRRARRSAHPAHSGRRAVASGMVVATVRRRSSRSRRIRGWQASPRCSRASSSSRCAIVCAGGIICQWAHTYDISDGDLRSIVATFRSVFPERHDVARRRRRSAARRIGRTARLAPVEYRERLAARRSRRGSRAPYRSTEPFGLWSLFAGGPDELKAYGAGRRLPDRRSDGARVLGSGLAQLIGLVHQCAGTEASPRRPPAPGDRRRASNQRGRLSGAVAPR